MPTTVLRVGLTGNIASGKSTVAGWLAEFGCRILDLDAIAHACLQPGEPTYDAVIETFGAAVVREDGSIDRSELGSVVFADEALRRVLEGILHPAVREREQALAAEAIRAGEAGIVVSEAALLYETGGADRYHRMVVVTAADDVRLQRLRSRGLSVEQARARMAAQMDQRRKAARADYVIDNTGSMDDARRKTQSLADHLHRDLTRRVAGKPLGEPPALD